MWAMLVIEFCAKEEHCARCFLRHIRKVFGTHFRNTDFGISRADILTSNIAQELGDGGVIVQSRITTLNLQFVVATKNTGNLESAV